MNPDPFTWTLGITLELIAVGVLGLAVCGLCAGLKRLARKPAVPLQPVVARSFDWALGDPFDPPYDRQAWAGFDQARGRHLHAVEKDAA